MITWTSVLSDAWSELALARPLERQYRSKVITDNIALEIRAAMRAVDDAPCLMLQTNLAADAHFELGGMRLSSVPDVSGPLLVLSLEDDGRRDLFTTVCSDVITFAAQVDDKDAQSRFLDRLDAWRHFLRDKKIGFSRSETIGLIGELVVLDRLIATKASNLATWEAPDDGLHDFQFNGHALEIKTSLGPAASINISRLDQLDITGLRQLDLLHVKLIEHPAGHNLNDIILSLNQMLPDLASRNAFDNALLRRGLLPDDEAARSSPRVQLRSIEAYSVTEAFPRLVRSQLPIAITEATYTLEIRALGNFHKDTTSVLNDFNEVRP